jgi:hypothetical protein
MFRKQYGNIVFLCLVLSFNYFFVKRHKFGFVTQALLSPTRLNSRLMNLWDHWPPLLVFSILWPPLLVPLNGLSCPFVKLRQQVQHYLGKIFNTQNQQCLYVI